MTTLRERRRSAQPILVVETRAGRGMRPVCDGRQASAEEAERYRRTEVNVEVDAGRSEHGAG